VLRVEQSLVYQNMQAIIVQTGPGSAALFKFSA